MKLIGISLSSGKKIGKGMVIIQIEDVNDNIPVIQGKDLIMCSKVDTLSSVLVEAVDMDKPPYSTPFIFEFGADHDGKWKLKDTTGKDCFLGLGVYQHFFDVIISQYSNNKARLMN